MIAQRLYIGNTNVFSSHFGMPSSNFVDSQGNMTLTQQVSNVSLTRLQLWKLAHC